LERALALAVAGTVAVAAFVEGLEDLAAARSAENPEAFQAVAVSRSSAVKAV